MVGPGVSRGVVADLTARLREDSSRLRVLGDGRQRRSYLHVEDCVTALLLAASVAGREPGLTVLNVASLDTITVAEVADIVAGCLPAGPTRVEFAGGTSWQGDATLLHPEPRRLLQAGWRPAFGSAQAVRAAAESLLPPRSRRSGTPCPTAHGTRERV